MATTQNIRAGASAHEQKQNANINDLAALASAASPANNESKDYRSVYRGGELHMEVLNRDLWPRTAAPIKGYTVVLDQDFCIDREIFTYR